MYGPPNPEFRARLLASSSPASMPSFSSSNGPPRCSSATGWTGRGCIEAVPRHRRVVIDCDGAYNDPIEFGGDYNHRSEASSRYWTHVCDSLSDKIFQPTLRPRRSNVRPFLFHIYDPTWETPLDFADKEFSMIYVGHTKFRWRGMSKVLRAIERVRDRVGRVALVGRGLGRAHGLDGAGRHQGQLLCRPRLSEEDRRRGPAGGALPASGRDHQQGRLQSRRVSAAVRVPRHGHVPDLRDAGRRHHSAIPARPGLCRRDFRRACHPADAG